MWRVREAAAERALGGRGCARLNLKLRAGGSDTPVMYFAAQPPPERVSGLLRALRLSLNAPVVDVEELPVGPARAGIALAGLPGGAPQLTVAVRSLRTGRLAFYAAAVEPDECGDEQLALDAALSFAESMGFLFDDDEVEARGDAGPAEAARLWRQLLGLEEPAESEPLELEEVVEGGPTPPPERVLTKFRRSPVRQGGRHGE